MRIAPEISHITHAAFLVFVRFSLVYYWRDVLFRGVFPPLDMYFSFAFYYGKKRPVGN